MNTIYMYSHFHAIKNVLLLFTLCHFDQCRWNYIGSDATINVCISTQTKRISSSFSFCKRRNRILAKHLHLLVEIVKKTATLKRKMKKKNSLCEAKYLSRMNWQKWNKRENFTTKRKGKCS